MVRQNRLVALPTMGQIMLCETLKAGRIPERGTLGGVGTDMLKYLCLFGRFTIKEWVILTNLIE